MPGILPMKVIKVGNSAQSRVAQACDRCRSKKIRCDGIRPCCTQCAHVGFECKTSDKLSRRAFPRGYTESLEERVRSLESEVRELKGLLDEKDEKIDVLSRIHSFSPSHHSDTSPHLPPKGSTKPLASEAVEARIKVQPLSTQSSGSHFDGLSSTRGFVDAFNSKLIEGGVSKAMQIQALTELPRSASSTRPDQATKVPPRIVSDQLINIFFQEWAPLYPVLHRPTALKAYERYLSNWELFKNNNIHEMTQLHLIFGIAGLASKSRTNHDATFFEGNWVYSLELLSQEVSLASLQCLVLAQIYYMTKADYKSLLRYRSFGINISQQLGLYRALKNDTSSILTVEMRKKVFWCQYVLDRFTAALTGLPVLLREADISAQYPEDVDDENVTETGFLPTLPGESTRLSSALALFKVSRILNEVLEILYPAETNHEIPVSKMRSVIGKLDEWSRNLPPHLRLEFPQDKPSTNVTSSRSPLLSIIYYYIRSLAQRPAVCFAMEQIKSPALLSLSDSGKHIIQILELLDERRLCLSVNINRSELILVAGLGLLWQNMGLKRDSKLVKESRKLLTSVVNQLESESPVTAAQLSEVANTLVSLDNRRGSSGKPLAADPSEKQAKRQLKSPKRQIQSWKQRLVGNVAPSTPAKPETPSRRATVSDAGLARTSSRSSIPSVYSEPIQQLHASVDQYLSPPGLDYEHTQVMTSTMESTNEVMTMADWEYVLGDMDRGYSNIFTGIYGGKECAEDSGPFASLTAEYSQKGGQLSMPASGLKQEDLSPETWSTSSSDIAGGHLDGTLNLLDQSGESMGSTEDCPAFYELPFRMEEQNSGFLDPFRGMILPEEEATGDIGLGWDRPLAV